MTREPSPPHTFLARTQKGSALVSTLLIATLLMVFCFVFITESNTATSFSSKQEAKTNAFYAAEAGAQRAYARLCQDIRWRSGFENERLGTAEYSVVLEDWLSDPALPAGAIRITSTGGARGIHKTVRMIVTPPSEEAFTYACFAAEDLVLRSSTYTYGSVRSGGRFDMGRGCTMLGNILASGDVSIGTESTCGAPSRLYGDVESGGDVGIAEACSVFSRDSVMSELGLPLRADGNVVARQGIDCWGHIQGDRRSLSHSPVEEIPFPQNFFDMKWPAPGQIYFRGWPLYAFDDPHRFEEFLEKSYSTKTETYMLHGIFLVKGNVDLRSPGPQDKVVVFGTLIAFGDVTFGTQAPLMFERADSTLPAIVALGSTTARGDIVLENDGGAISVGGLLYAKGEVYLGARGPENPIQVSGAVCARKVVCGGGTTVTYNPSVKSVLPLSSQPLLVQSWDEI
jgi:hypothetical protein